MDPTERIDIDRFDSWLDELTRGFASSAPDDASELAQAATWLHEKGQQTMSAKLFRQQLMTELQPVAIGGMSTTGQPIPPPPMPLPRTAIRPTPRRWLLAAAAVMLFVLPFAILLVRSFGNDSNGPTIQAPMNGLTQSGTPVPCSVIPPSTLKISGTPEHESILVANTNRSYPNIPGAGGPVIYQADLPDGPPAASEDLEAIQRTLTQFSNCLYTGDIVAVGYLFSDDSYRRGGSDREDHVASTATPNPTVALIPTRIDPLDARSTPVQPVILRSNVLDDGRIGVLLQEDLTGYGLQQYFIMVNSDRGWLVDEEINVTPETEPSPDAPPSLEIDAVDLQFLPSEVHVPANVEVTLVVTNEGQARKTFVISELGIDVELPVGKTVKIAVNAPQGVYEFYSDVPGQQAAGMRGWLVVIPEN